MENLEAAITKITEIILENLEEKLPQNLTHVSQIVMIQVSQGFIVYVN